MPLSGKHVLVTGASRGIGAAAASALAASGARVTLTARDGVLSGGIAKRIGGSGGKAQAMACDVADWDAVSRLVAEAQRRFGPIDAVVNNAGVIEPIARIADGDPAQWALGVQINLVGAYHVIRAVLPEMLAAGAGTIVNVSSGAAGRPQEGWSAYCAAKAGLAMLTQAIALEAGARGVRVFGFRPGTTDTDMQARIRASGINPVSRIPRQALTPVAEPARAIVYLCTGEAADLAGTEVALGDADFRRRIGFG